MLFIESQIFTTATRRILSDDDLIDLQKCLLQYPKLGKVIPGTGGLRKLRIGDQTRQRGKRGGARVIYFFLEREMHIHLLLLYTKDQMLDLSQDQKRFLKGLVQEIEND